MNLQTDNMKRVLLFFFPNVAVGQYKRTGTIYRY